MPGSFLGQRGEGRARAGIPPTSELGGHTARTVLSSRAPTDPSEAGFPQVTTTTRERPWLLGPEPVGTEWALPVSRPPSHQAASLAKFPRLERLTPAADTECSGWSERALHGTCPPGLLRPVRR